MATFGYTTIGSSSVAIENTYAYTNFVLPEDGTVTKITAYIVNPTVNRLATAGVYSGTSLVAGGESDEITMTADVTGWFDLPFSTPLELTAGTYGLLFTCQGGSGVATIALDVGSNASRREALTYAGAPATVAATNATDNYSIYATYTPASASEVKTMNGVAWADVKSVNGIT
jgi:hypothetical protein